MNALRRSVRARLIASLLAGLAVVWVAMAAATLVEADHEVEEVFDAHLAQSATLLAMRIGEEADEIDLEHAPVPHKYAQRLSFQIWKRSPHRPTGAWPYLRVAHFALSFGLVALLVLVAL